MYTVTWASILEWSEVRLALPGDTAVINKSIINIQTDQGDETEGLERDRLEREGVKRLIIV